MAAVNDFELADLQMVAVTPQPVKNPQQLNATCQPRKATSRIHTGDHASHLATSMKSRSLNGPISGEPVKVYVRVKPPLAALERPGAVVTDNGSLEAVTISQSNTEITINNFSDRLVSFSYDRVLPGKTSQQQVYEVVAAEVLTQVMQGYNGTVFAYGQTGSGKTYTMSGENQNGLTFRAIDKVMHELEQTGLPFKCFVSVYEVYNEALFVLLSQQGVEKRATDATSYKTIKPWLIASSGVDVAKHKVAEALSRRTQDSTVRNASSSRSHAIVKLTIEQLSSNLRLSLGSFPSVSAPSTTTSVAGSITARTSNLFLVDLAGSESIVNATGTPQRAETKNINSSLAALERVFQCLEQRQPHIPFRDSMLTRVLQEGLDPHNARVVLCATISPYVSDFEQTKSTLNFASRARNVRTYAKVNMVSKPDLASQQAVHRALMAQVQQLRAENASLQQSAADADERLTQVNELNQRIEQMQEEMRVISESYVELQQESTAKIQQLQAAALDAPAKLHAEGVRNRQLQESLANVRCEADTARSQAHEMRDKLSRTELELAHYKAAVAGEKEQVRQYKDLLQASQGTESALMRQVADLRGRLATVETEASAAREGQQQLSVQLRAVQAELVDWRAQALSAGELEEQVVMAAEHKAQLEQCVLELEQERDDAVDARDQQAEDIFALQQQLQDLEGQLVLAQQQAKDSMDGAEAAWTAERQRLQSQLDETAEGNASVRNECAVLRARVHELEGLLANSEQAYVAARQGTDQLAMQLDQMTVELATARQAHTDAQAAANQAAQSWQEVEVQLRADHAAAQHTIAALRQEIQQLKAALEAAQAAQAAHKAEVQADLQVALQRASEAEARVASVEAQYHSEVVAPRREALLAEQRCKAVEAQLKRNTEEQNRLKADYTAKEELMQQQIRTLQRQANSLETGGGSAARQLQAEKEQLEAENRRLQQELQMYQQAAAGLEPDAASPGMMASPRGSGGGARLPYSAAPCTTPSGFALLGRTTTIGAAALRRTASKPGQAVGDAAALITAKNGSSKGSKGSSRSTGEEGSHTIINLTESPGIIDLAADSPATPAESPLDPIFEAPGARRMYDMSIKSNKFAL